MTVEIGTETSPDKEFYDREPLGSELEHRRFMEEIQCYFGAYSDRLDRELAGTSGRVAELGAGSCGLSSCASRLPSVRKVYAADISSIRMNKMLALSAKILGADLSKIETVECDFNQRLPFDDETLDAVLFDAALHHSRTMWGLLAECHRVLRSGGLLIAQREAYLSPLRAGRQLGVLLQSPEVSAQVSENMYLLEQYEYYLKVNGFDVSFIPYSQSSLKRSLKPLNGTLFTDGVLFARKGQSRAA